MFDKNLNWGGCGNEDCRVINFEVEGGPYGSLGLVVLGVFPTLTSLRSSGPLGYILNSLAGCGSDDHIFLSPLQGPS